MGFLEIDGFSNENTLKIRDILHECGYMCGLLIRVHTNNDKIQTS